MRISSLPLLLSLIAFSFISCKSTSTVKSINTGIDSNWKGGQPYELLVVSHFLNAQLRELFEVEMTQALRDEGVNATPSIIVLPDVTTINQQTIRRIMASRPNVALLFTKAVTVSRVESQSKQASAPFTAMMESGLYVQGQQSAVWWNRTQLDSDQTASREAVAAFVKSEMRAMKKSGVFERLGASK